MPRQRTPELMDDPAVPRDQLDDSLRFIRAVNRRLGGIDALLRPLARWCDELAPAAPVRLLDVATGSADIPVAAMKWARERGIDLRITAVDNHATTLQLARDHIEHQLGASDPGATGIELVQHDALALLERFEPRTFDVVHAGMFIHHLDELPALKVLRSMDRLAARGVVWNDLARTNLARLGSTLITLRANHIVKHDARVSVRGAFTKREALGMAKRAGWDDAKATASLLHQRIVVTNEKWGGRVLKESELREEAGA